MAATLYARGSILAMLLGSIRRNVLATMTQSQPQQPRTGPGFAGRWGGRHGSLEGASLASSAYPKQDGKEHVCWPLLYSTYKRRRRRQQ